MEPRAVLLGGLALLVYLALMSRGTFRFGASPYPYFNYLADAFLKGSLSLLEVPRSTHDLSLYQGKLYLYWPPLAAILMMPYVALFGLHASDRFFTGAFGALNVFLLAALLKRLNDSGWVKSDPGNRTWVTLAFAFGTVHFYSSVIGRVWFTGQVTAVTFVLLSLLLLAKSNLLAWRAPAAGSSLALAILGRSHLILGLPLYLWLLWKNSPGEANVRERIKRGVLFLVPIALALGLLLLYNYLRFGSPWDNGVAYQKMGKSFVVGFHTYGLMSVHYLPRNLFYYFLGLPRLEAHFPFVVPTGIGESIFLVTPIFAYAFYAVLREIEKRQMGLPAWLGLSALLTSVPIFLNIGTGEMQFGQRYSLDYTPQLIVLTVIGMHGRTSGLVKVLIVYGIIANIFGLAWYAEWI